MRQRLLVFLPIFLFAIAVQILAPIAAAWAAASAASDPLQAAEICHSLTGTASDQGDQNGDHSAGACIICCAAQAVAAIDTPQPVALMLLHRQTTRVVWHDFEAEFSVLRSGSSAWARAPPALS